VVVFVVVAGAILSSSQFLMYVGCGCEFAMQAWQRRLESRASRARITHTEVLPSQLPQTSPGAPQTYKRNRTPLLSLDSALLYAREVLSNIYCDFTSVFTLFTRACALSLTTSLTTAPSITSIRDCHPTFSACTRDFKRIPRTTIAHLHLAEPMLATSTL